MVHVYPVIVRDNALCTSPTTVPASHFHAMVSVCAAVCQNILHFSWSSVCGISDQNKARPHAPVYNRCAANKAGARLSANSLVMVSSNEWCIWSSQVNVMWHKDQNAVSHCFTATVQVVGGPHMKHMSVLTSQALLYSDSNVLRPRLSQNQ